MRIRILRTRAGSGFASPNPLFMRYTPSAEGKFVGQGGYGYRSIEAFVSAVGALSRGTVASCTEFDATLATVHTTMQTTAILEAGRRSLDADGMYGQPPGACVLRVWCSSLPAHGAAVCCVRRVCRHACPDLLR
ncbi:hypothetical protein EON66_09245 [archaeon]|nr:MAG: hypothetical protein EON66_09245 [archaeon]